MTATLTRAKAKRVPMLVALASAPSGTRPEVRAKGLPINQVSGKRGAGLRGETWPKILGHQAVP